MRLTCSVEMRANKATCWMRNICHRILLKQKSLQRLCTRLLCHMSLSLNTIKWKSITIKNSRLEVVGPVRIL